MRIQHNIMAMNAYRNYTNNVSAMKSNLEKLSSGYKINRAGDDAAGLAISEKMRAQITGLETAQKNAKDGISLVQTAEGAMTEVHDMLNRMVELATQSANGTYDNTVDRAQMQKEMNQLRDEINRIADSSNFNGIKLLDGSMDTSVKSTGDKDLFDGTNLKVIADGQLGNKPQAGVFELDLDGLEVTAAADGDVKISVFGQEIAVGDVAALEGDKFTGEQIAKAIVENWEEDGVTGADYLTDYKVSLKATRNGSKVTFTMSDAPSKAWDLSSAVTFTNTKNTGTLGEGNQAHGVQVKTLTEPVDNSASRWYAQAELNLTGLTIEDGSTLTIGDTTYTFAVGKGSAFKDSENVIDLTDMTEITMSDKTTAGKVASRITTAAKDNKNFKVTANSQVGSATNSTAGQKKGYIYLTELEGGVDTDNYKLEGKANNSATNSKDGDWTGLVKFGKVDSASMGKALTLQIGDTADSFNQLKVSISDLHCDAMGIADISIADQDSAAEAVKAIKDAINYVSDVRGTLGATQNRLDHTINNLSVMTENIQDAESTIRDVDVAEEMMAYTKNNILIQSAQAMLAQANQVPQGVLQLLG